MSLAYTCSASESLASSAGAPGLRSCLIVTASAGTRRMYAEYLAWRGLRVREVSGAGAALEELSRFNPDVVLIEDRLADGNGVDLALTLRRSRRTSRIPIALLSGDVFRMNPVRARRFGCDVLIPVPCLPDTLFDALDQLAHDGASARPIEISPWLA